MSLCFKPDDFVVEKVHWIAVLSDGSQVYQDDNRPGEIPAAAWLRLSDYVKLKEVEDDAFGITNLYVKFWDHTEEVAPGGSAAYYFINGVASCPGLEDSDSQYYYVIGAVAPNSDKLDVVKWAVPAIIPFETEVRSIPYGDNLLIKGAQPWQKNDPKKVVINPDLGPVG